MPSWRWTPRAARFTLTSWAPPSLWSPLRLGWQPTTMGPWARGLAVRPVSPTERQGILITNDAGRQFLYQRALRPTPSDSLTVRIAGCIYRSLPAWSEAADSWGSSSPRTTSDTDSVKSLCMKGSHLAPLRFVNLAALGFQLDWGARPAPQAHNPEQLPQHWISGRGRA